MDSESIFFWMGDQNQLFISALKILHVNIKTVRYSSADTQALQWRTLASSAFLRPIRIQYLTFISESLFKKLFLQNTHFSGLRIRINLMQIRVPIPLFTLTQNPAFCGFGSCSSSKCCKFVLCLHTLHASICERQCPSMAPLWAFKALESNLMRDPDQAFYSTSDPDQTSQNNANPSELRSPDIFQQNFFFQTRSNLKTKHGD